MKLQLLLIAFCDNETHKDDTPPAVTAGDPCGSIGVPENSSDTKIISQNL